MKTSVDNPVIEKPNNHLNTIAMKTTFQFYKENLTNKQFTLTIEETKIQFKEWMQLKEKSWLEYYHRILERTFVTDKTGLNSTMDHTEYSELETELNTTKWEYLKSIGIN